MSVWAAFVAAAITKDRPPARGGGGLGWAGRVVVFGREAVVGGVVLVWCWVGWGGGGIWRGAGGMSDGFT